MKQHKWHKEIKAWADGAKIEVKHIAENEWENFEGDWSLTEGYEFRIKTQPIPKGFPCNNTPTGIKEPQYLYAYIDKRNNSIEFANKWSDDSVYPMLGKIKLEVEE